MRLSQSGWATDSSQVSRGASDDYTLGGDLGHALRQVAHFTYLDTLIFLSNDQC